MAVEAQQGPATLMALRAGGVMTEPITPTPSLVFGSTGLSFKGANDSLPPAVSDFSRKDPDIWVYTMWQRKEKRNRGTIGAKIYDAQNRQRVVVAGKKVRIPSEAPIRYGFSFSPAALETGAYRVDVLFDGQPAWRTFVRITD